MSARTTAARGGGRTNLLLVVLLAFLLGGFTALWPAQVTVGWPSAPSLNAASQAADVRDDGESPVLPTPVHLGSSGQHHSYGHVGDSPWQDITESWSLSEDHLAVAHAVPTTVRLLVLTGSLPAPHPRGPPETTERR